MSRKGSVFERSIAVMLSEWWTDGKRSDIFWRSTTSGARATVRSRQGKTTAGHYGDICAIDPIGNPFIRVFTTELKNGYSSKTIGDMLDRPLKAKESQYEQWFSKVAKSAGDAKSLGWLFIHHRVRRKTMCFLPFDLWHDLRPHIRRNENPPGTAIVNHRRLGKIAAMGFSLFLAQTEPKDVLRIAKTV